MAEYKYIVGKRKKWASFIKSIKEGEHAVLSVASQKEVDVIRAVASRVNSNSDQPFKYSVEANNKIMVVRISTKTPL